VWISLDVKHQTSAGDAKRPGTDCLRSRPASTGVPGHIDRLASHETQDDQHEAGPTRGSITRSYEPFRVVSPRPAVVPGCQPLLRSR
jgi:hypothetical protein